jgi:hypothetical protein
VKATSNVLKKTDDEGSDYMAYYSERHGVRKQIEKTYDISVDAYNLILEIIEKYLINLAWKFPKGCPDNNANICEINMENFYRNLMYEIPGLFNEDGFNVPKSRHNIFDGESVDEYDQFALLDYIEYMAMNIKDYVVVGYHSFFSHNHYNFVKGDMFFNDFCDEIDHKFEKVGLLYKMNDNGQVERLVENESLIKTVERQVQAVKEKGLKDLIEDAISLYKDPNTDRIKDATEKLWDAFERLKTYHITMDKKSSAEKIVTDASSGNANFEKMLNDEFGALTRIGNEYRIRHHETNKIEITDINHYEYFFNRCLSAISLILKYLK